jgi:CRISPR-associated protein Csb1
MTSTTTIRIPLVPVAGDRFQPTGFPDLGAATFQAPGREATGPKWVEALHVESPQSMANRLELTTWDAATQDQVADLAGLPHLRVVDPDGSFLTSSRLEAHRLAAAYVMDGKIAGTPGREWLAAHLGVVKGRGLDHRALAREVCRLDPVSLVHGVFFAQKAWPWQPKIARALTCFIDAYDVRPAVSGGVKTDSVDPRVEEGRSTAEGYGMVPHQRVEYTAQQIDAYVVVDRGQIRSYGLGAEGEQLLTALVDYELAHLFRGGSLRLRTACNLTVRDGADAALAAIPELDAAAAAVRAAITAAGDVLGPVTEVVWAGKGKG